MDPGVEEPLGFRPLRPEGCWFNPGKPIKAAEAQISYEVVGGPMITVGNMARAIEKRLGATKAEAQAQARTVMSYFGFRTEIIDNSILPDDRKLFYNLADAGLLQTSWETVPLLDGRNWRIFYWTLNERDIDRILAAEVPTTTEPLYSSLPDEAWGRSAPAPS